MDTCKLPLPVLAHEHERVSEGLRQGVTLEGADGGLAGGDDGDGTTASYVCFVEAEGLIPEVVAVVAGQPRRFR